MAIPRPGEKVRGSESGTPINALFDLMGRRWALGVVWNLNNETLSFRELQSRCELRGGTISPSILNQRIKDLNAADILEKSPEGYRLTPRGVDLRTHLIPIGNWALDWSKEIFGYSKP